jgi:hypothetical protein
MSEQPSVSDLVFRDIAPKAAATPAVRDDEWQALLREELGKLRPPRTGPRVVPATSAAEQRLKQPAQ